MQGDKKTIALLNEALKNQLTLVNQLFLHARMLKHWGLRQLNKHVYEQSLQAMKQSDELIKRILLLEGLPNLQHIEKLLIGETVDEVLNGDLALRQQEQEALRRAISHCETARDYTSRVLLKALLETNEEHIDWIESQFWLIENSGLEQYLQSQT